MKKLFLILISVVFSANIFGQTYVITNNSTFDSVKVVPANPTINDSIKLVVYISNENDYRAFMFIICPSCPLSVNFTINNDTITVTEISLEPATPPNSGNLIDTVSVGKLSPGQFTVVLRNQLSTVYGGPEPTFTHYIDSAEIILQISLSIPEEDVNDNFFSLYPNPTSDNIFVKLTQKSQLNIFNIEGQMIKTINAAENVAIIDISSLARGMYFIKAANEKGVAMRKFVKE